MGTFHLRIWASAAVVAGAMALTQASEACSRVQWSNSGLGVLVGRNMDWARDDMGSKLWVFPRGMERDGAAGRNSARWTSKYGSVVVSAYDLSSADGMNERGLAANILWLCEADFGARNEAVPGLCASLWAQYCLDNFETVADAVKGFEDGTIQVMTAPLPGTTAKSPVHLSLSDATGDSAVIEYLNGKACVYHDRRYTVMTNSPPFPEQLANLKQYKPFGGTKDLPGSVLPEDRFVRAAAYLDSLPKPKDQRQAVAFLLSVMRNVAAPYRKVSEGDRPEMHATRWRTVADLTRKVYFFESTVSPNVVWVDMGRLDFTEGAPVKMLDPAAGDDPAGEVSARVKTATPFKFAAAAAR